MVEFGNPLGLIALSSVAVLIILYLLYRKPIKKVFPSIMFFMRHEKSSKTAVAWKYFSSNALFYLQLLALLLAALAIAAPFLNVASSTIEEHAVIILDTSASMQASHESGTRFDAAVRQAINDIEGKQRVSIILAESFPLIALEKGSQQQAQVILQNIKPSDTPSNLGDAMLQALTLVDGGGVVVYSDFGLSEGVDPLVAKQQLESAGTEVQFKQFHSAVRNTGITDAQVLGGSAIVKIKNYQQNPVDLTVKGVEEQQLTLEPGALGQVRMSLNPGTNEISIGNNDHFALDDSITLVLPEKGRINTLIVTNKESGDFFRTALSSLGLLNINEAHPPVIPTETYDLYIIHEVDVNKLLPTTFEDIARKVEQGSHVIIHVQRDDIDYGRLGVLNRETRQSAAPLIDRVQNQVTKELRFGTNPYYATSEEDCDAWVVTQNEDAVICQKRMGQGSIIWYGIPEDASFRSTPDYPLFFDGIIRDMFGLEQGDTRNKKTGTLLAIPMQTAQTPLGEIRTNRLLMNEQGIYEIEEGKFSANLLNYDESNLNIMQNIEEGTFTASTAKASSTKKELAKILIGIALLLVIIEFIIVKWRGDL